MPRHVKFHFRKLPRNTNSSNNRKFRICRNFFGSLALLFVFSFHCVSNSHIQQLIINAKLFLSRQVQAIIRKMFVIQVQLSWHCRNGQWLITLFNRYGIGVVTFNKIYSIYFFIKNVASLDCSFDKKTWICIARN